ncbi:GntR family transcriptional regulator [Streptomyces spectabilis]|uniref:GntR family transcriptional regulator n=1 Tax=Streptomyces spectabilis TaxID=68270 RepID=UPI0033E22C75
MAATERQHIARPEPLYVHVARKLAEEIREGKYEPGDLLPSENAMVQMYGIAKATVRSAVAELRGMGLVEVRQGKGATVLDRTRSRATYSVDRSVYRSGKTWQLPDLTEAEKPAVSRTTLTGELGDLLRQRDQDALSVDRTFRDPQTAARVAHRTIIPLATAAEVPALAETPDAPLAEVYAHLAEGRTLTITEHITARIPFPDERTALALADSGPLMVTYRIISDADTDCPLICEELRAPAASTRVTIHLAPTRRPAAKKTPPKSA